MYNVYNENGEVVGHQKNTPISPTKNETNDYNDAIGKRFTLFMTAFTMPKKSLIEFGHEVGGL